MSDAAMVKTLPWMMSMDGRYLYHQDHPADIRLDVDGDWESDEQRIEYTKNLMRALNLAESPSGNNVKESE